MDYQMKSHRDRQYLITKIFQQPELRDILPKDFAELMDIDYKEFQTLLYNSFNNVTSEFVEKMAEAVYYKVEWKNESKELGILVNEKDEDEEKNDLDKMSVEELIDTNKKLKDIVNTLLNEQEMT